MLTECPNCTHPCMYKQTCWVNQTCNEPGKQKAVQCPIERVGSSVFVFTVLAFVVYSLHDVGKILDDAEDTTNNEIDRYVALVWAVMQEHGACSTDIQLLHLYHVTHQLHRCIFITTGLYICFKSGLHWLVGLLTGHNTMNRHLTLLRRMVDPLCPFCKEEEDTSLHYLGSCCAIANKRRELFVKHFLGQSDLRQELYLHLMMQKSLELSGMQKPAEGFSSLWVNTGMCIGPAGGLSPRR